MQVLRSSLLGTDDVCKHTSVSLPASVPLSGGRREGGCKGTPTVRPADKDKTREEETDEKIQK